MKALTLWQPWAWLIVAGHKDIENRGWKPGRRLEIGERFLVHAGKKIDWDYSQKRSKAWPDAKLPELPVEAFIAGAIIGSVQYDGVVESSESPWFFGPYGWLVSNPIKFEEPIPCRGHQMLWNAPDDILGHTGGIVRSTEKAKL
ncbi:hypothetical protein LCGC14_2412620 [marine sediment metagenome]|uniref:ASCH domain-containing protein n=1 Tax=marine sediment metagenome TaxID=412755 RepID=A0A0F9CE87_9ZZZZ